MSAKIWHCARLIRSLASPKILTLGKIKINFAFALDLFDRWLRPRYSRSAKSK